MDASAFTDTYTLVKGQAELSQCVVLLFGAQRIV